MVIGIWWYVLIRISQFWVFNLWTWFERNICDAGWIISGEDRCCFQTVDQGNVIDLELPAVVNCLLRFCSESLCLFHSATGCISSDFLPLSFIPSYLHTFIPPYQGMFEDKINDPAVREYFEVTLSGKKINKINKNPRILAASQPGLGLGCMGCMVLLQAVGWGWWWFSGDWGTMGWKNIGRPEGRKREGLSVHRKKKNIYIYDICVFFFQRDLFPCFPIQNVRFLPQEFFLGCLRFRGPARSMDVGRLLQVGSEVWVEKIQNTNGKLPKYGRFLCFHLDGIFQVVCDWEFSPERNPPFSWNVLQNDLLYNLWYIVLASELSRKKSGHPSCRNWSLLSCLVSFLATHDHRTRSGSSRVKEPHAMKCFLGTFQLDSHGNGGQSTVVSAQTVSVKL